MIWKRNLQERKYTYEQMLIVISNQEDNNFKLRWDAILHPTIFINRMAEWSQTLSRIGKKVAPQKLLYIVGGHVNWFSNFENQFGDI